MIWLASRRLHPTTDHRQLPTCSLRPLTCSIASGPETRKIHGIRPYLLNLLSSCSPFARNPVPMIPARPAAGTEAVICEAFPTCLSPPRVACGSPRTKFRKAGRQESRKKIFRGARRSVRFLPSCLPDLNLGNRSPAFTVQWECRNPPRVLMSRTDCASPLIIYRSHHPEIRRHNKMRRWPRIWKRNPESGKLCTPSHRSIRRFCPDLCGRSQVSSSSPARGDLDFSPPLARGSGLSAAE